MTETSTTPPLDDDKEGWSIQELWFKYEDLAMHFNDLLIRLRTQALGGVAVISTFVGIFSKLRDASDTWEIVIFLPLGLCVFWIAIWVLDFWYYNKLLSGAVTALLVLEQESKVRKRIGAIQFSTMVEAYMAGSMPFTRAQTKRELFMLRFGRWFFYSIVFVAIVIGLVFATMMHVGTNL